MFCAHLSWGYWAQEDFKNAYLCASRALKLGEETKDKFVIGYAYSCMAHSGAELGFVDEAILLGEKAREISKSCSENPHIPLHARAISSAAYALLPSYC